MVPFVTAVRSPHGDSRPIAWTCDASRTKPNRTGHEQTRGVHHGCCAGSRLRPPGCTCHRARARFRSDRAGGLGARVGRGVRVRRRGGGERSRRASHAWLGQVRVRPACGRGRNRRGALVGTAVVRPDDARAARGRQSPAGAERSQPRRRGVDDPAGASGRSVVRRDASPVAASWPVRPPRALVPAFTVVAAYFGIRLAFLVRPTYAQAKFSEWPELCFAAAVALTAVSTLSRLRGPAAPVGAISGRRSMRRL